jgi:hypothetical protein
MIRPAFPLVLLAATAGCAAPRAQSADATPASGCAVRIAFGSYAMGIDRAAFDNVRALLAGQRTVRGVEEQRWGREGEVTLCVTASNPRRLARTVARVLPAKPRGPITIETRDGLRIERSQPPGS